jgi:hypothetical protein
MKQKCKSKQIDTIVPLHTDILVHNSDLDSDSDSKFDKKVVVVVIISFSNRPHKVFI